jgi:hypothetical protein
MLRRGRWSSSQTLTWRCGRGEGEGGEAGGDGVVAVDQVGGLHAVAGLDRVGVVAVDAKQRAAGAVEAGEAEDHPGDAAGLAGRRAGSLGGALDLAAVAVRGVGQSSSIQAS